MLVGASGVGKSTFGNYLLGQNPGERFHVGGGWDPITTQCQALQDDNSDPTGTLTVIDTPGMPDPDGNTAQYFNSIVEGARGAGSLSALVLVVDYAADRNH
ncbi:unnamed protein product, partial [Scytosiphon promiscuus]